MTANLPIQSTAHLSDAAQAAHAGDPDAAVDPLLDLIHEDADLLVVNKPAGLVCHPSKQGPRSSLIGRLRLYFESQSTPDRPAPSPTPGLVNRLDRETSGLVLVAKHPESASELGKLLQARGFEKIYLAVVHGHIGPDSGVIDAPLGKDVQSAVAIKDCVCINGAQAQTNFHVLRRFQNQHGLFSLVNVQPLTGRKHQIRIHFAHTGHPILGDKLYGGDENLYLDFVLHRQTEAQRQRLIREHHALHAHRLSFSWRAQQWSFTAPPDPWYEQFAGGGI